MALLTFKQFNEGYPLDVPVDTVDQIAKKHNVTKDYVLKQLEAGIKVEHEHTKETKDARRIALAHLGEKPDYYIKLKKVENFQDGRNPQDKGDMARYGLKGKSISQLKKVRSSSNASPRQKQLAHWFINMHKGKN